MKSFSALASFAALTLVIFRVEVWASPTPTQGSVEDSAQVLPREPILLSTGGSTGEGNLLIREAKPYGRDRHHRNWGYRRDFDDLSAPDNDVDSKREVEHYGHHYHRYHHHRHFKFPRDEDSVGAPDRGDGVDSFEGNLASETSVKREGGYYNHRHRNRYYRRDDADPGNALVSLNQAKRDGGHYGHRHRPRYSRREYADFENALAPLDQAKREEGYFVRHHHRHRHFLRDGDTVGIPLDQEIEGRSYDRLQREEDPEEEIIITRGVAEQDVDQHHRHHRYPRDTEHRGWRHHRKYYRREDMPSELDLQPLVDRDDEHYHHHYNRRDAVIDADDDREGKKGHPKKGSAADEVKEGVTHSVDTGIKSLSGFLGLDL